RSRRLRTRSRRPWDSIATTSDSIATTSDSIAMALGLTPEHDRSRRGEADEASACPLPCNEILDARDDRVERHLILAPLGDDEVGVALRRLDELLVHRPNRVQVLMDDRVERPAARLDVARQTAGDADVC